MSPYGAPQTPQTPQTLELFLTGRGPLAATELIPMLGAVMDQLSTLHSAGQHHGNLTPETITVTPTPEGSMVAWLPPSTPPAAGAWPFFQSPEQQFGGGQLGYWSDIYAMAGILYRTLTGQPPFYGANAEEVRQGHLQSPPPSVRVMRPDLPPELDAALLQGLAKAPADRHASMQAFRQVVQSAALAAPPPMAAYTAAPAVAAPPPPMVPPAPMPQAKSSGAKVALIGGIAALTMVGGLVFVLLAPSSHDQTASSSSTAKPQPVAKRAQPTKRGAVKKPVTPPPDPTPLALPGVDDKIKTAPSPAVADAADHVLLNINKQPWFGGRDALVVIAIMSDFQCPYAKRVSPLLVTLVKKYKSDLKVVWFDFPLRFHKQAMPAAIAARSVFAQGGNQKFWGFHNKVFANSKSITTDSLANWAKEVGANSDEVKRDLEAGPKRKFITETIRRAKQIGVRGTPTLFVNGVKFKGRRSVDGFSTIIDAELDTARRAIKAGTTTRQKYYAHLMQGERGRQLVKAGADAKTGKKAKRKRRQLDPKAIYRIPVFKDDPWKGAKRPLVTMVIWSDFQCPYCRGMACTLEEVIKKYRKTVRLVYRHNPLAFHKNAMPAAEALEAARAQKGRKGFWRLYAKVFPIGLCPRKTSNIKVRKWLDKIRGRHPKLTRSNLERFAKKARLRMSKFRRSMDRHTHRARIKAQATAAKELGARGVPALFVNGRYVRGYRNFDKLKVIIDAELKKARRLVKSGVSKRKLYKHITARGARKLVYLD